MNKLCVFFAIVIFTNGIYGQNLDEIVGMLSNQNESTIQSQTVAECIRTCPVTSEYNPVCGTDNVTYDNPGRLECAQACGVNVRLLRKSRCIVPEQ